MLLAAVAALSLISGQAPGATPESAGASERAALAAERAASAAEKAAAAAESAAKSLEAMAAARAAPAPLPVAPEVAKPAAPGWTATVGLGLVSLTGNSSALTFTLNGAVEKKQEKWIWSAKAVSAYGQSRPAVSSGPSEVVALNAGVQLRADYRATQSVTGYLKAGLETDHVKSIEARELVEAGTGITWIEEKEADKVTLALRTDLAVRYAHESRFQYYPTPLPLEGVDMVAPRLGLAFRYALSEGIIFTEDAEVLPNVLGDGRVLVNSTTKIAARLAKPLALGVSFVVNHDSLPAPGKVPTDTALAVVLELAM